jgi:hypothetical protein
MLQDKSGIFVNDNNATMKQTLLLAAILCLAIISTGQDNSFKTYRKPGMQKEVRNQGFHSFTHYGPETRWMPVQAENEIPPAVRHNSSGSRQSHTITFHTDPSNTGFMLVLESADTAMGFFLDNGDMITLDDGYYDLIADPWLGPFDPQYLLLDRLHVYKNMDTTLALSSAVYGIKLNILDENGNILDPPVWSSGNGIGKLVELTPGMRFPDWSGTSSGVLQDSLRITPIPPTMKVLVSREALVQHGNYYSYVINYPVLENVTGDTVLSNAPGELQEFPHVFQATPAGKEFYLCWGYGPVDNPLVTGAIDTFVGAFIDNSCPSAKTDNVQLFVNHGVNDSALAFFASFIDQVQYDPAANPGTLGDLMSPISYLDVTDDLILSIQGNYPPVNGDYRIHPGESAFIGTSPPYNVTWSYSEPQSNFIWLSTHHRGPANERRYVDASVGTYQVWKDGQMLMHDTLRNFHFNLGFPSSGEYQFIINDSNYAVCGHPGFHQAILDFDLSDPVDPNSPTPVSFMVLQGDRVAEEIVSGFNASVRVTAADYEFITGDPNKYYHSICQADLYYKKHDTENWVLLNLVPLAGQLDSLCGMPYYADLAPVMNAVSDSSWIDLMLELTDSAENMNIQKFCPAFLLRDVMVGAGNREKEPFGFYPNPVKEKLSIIHPANVESVSLYTVEGKFLLTRENPVSIDMTSFLPGVYIIKAIGKNGNIVVDRILKI